MQTAVEHSSAENADTKELETSIIEKDDQRTIPLDKSLDPLQWSKKYKWFMVALIECMTLIDALATMICIPAVPQILSDFHVSDGTYSTLLVSIWEIGEGLGPLIIGPLSEERYGRLRVYHIANALFVLCSIANALSQNIGMVVTWRLMSGLTVASITIGPGIVSDMFVQEERGVAVAALETGSLIAPLIAPVIGSYLAEKAGWRWTFWLVAIAAGIVALISFLTMKESNRHMLSRQQGGEIIKPMQNEQKKSELLTLSLLRPLKLLVLSPILLITSLYTAVVYGYFYLIVTTMTEAFESVYKFSDGNIGLIYLASGAGTILGVVLCGSTLDWYLKKRARSNEMKPEYRLPLTVVGAAVLPMGLFLYGWTIDKHLQWMVPLTGCALIGFSVMLVIVPANTYVMDCFPERAASAVSAGNILRALVGALFPLVGPRLYSTLGQGWGNSVLGFVSLAFLPIPVLLMKYGERSRKKHPVNL